MKKILCACAFLLATVAVFAVDIGTALDQAAEQFSSTLQTGTTIAIVGIASDTEDMSEYMLDELTLSFVRQRRLTVANRANLDAIKKEMNFQLSGEVSDASIQEIGAMAGAETVVHGRLEQVGDMFFLMVQALDVKTATVEDMYRETVTLDEFAAALLGKTITSKGSILDISTDYTSGERISLGFQNLVFGLGAYRAGYVVDGVILTITHLAGYGCLAVVTALNPETGLGVMTGVPIFLASALYGFIRPIFYHKPSAKIGAFGEPDGLRLAIMPLGDTPVMQVSYRKSF
ncbi:MAG: hypothetical protein IAA16_02480 [Candidatus Treponema excrementipullorum]|uniref:Uncharacterized protein n=1 Tax=Candidatus Treponema excrementipullorum TaxID=2838768 RepID=A0A9E2L102_9SPIR|nr:hypothetical protein [Candidatus Treponema excrementipullorum]